MIVLLLTASQIDVEELFDEFIMADFVLFRTLFLAGHMVRDA